MGMPMGMGMDGLSLAAAGTGSDMLTVASQGRLLRSRLPLWRRRSVAVLQSLRLLRRLLTIVYPQRTRTVRTQALELVL